MLKMLIFALYQEKVPTATKLEDGTYARLDHAGDKQFELYLIQIKGGAEHTVSTKQKRALLGTHLGTLQRLQQEQKIPLTKVFLAEKHEGLLRTALRNFDGASSIERIILK